MVALSVGVVGAVGRCCCLRPVSAPFSGSLVGLGAAAGSIRGKKYKPFHNMYRSNRLRDIRKKEREATEAVALGGDVDAAEAAVVNSKEPLVATTPFQATRLMRSFDVFADKASTINFTTKLNVDMSRESVRGTCHLPNGLSSKIRVLAFCADDEAEEMIQCGADFAGISDPLRRIGQGWLGFDRCLATPQIMPQVMKIARVLGPKKMMPNPKSGTVVTNLRQAIKEAKGGTLLEYRAESEGVVSATIADVSFTDGMVLDNIKFFVQTLLRARPRGPGSSGSGVTGAGGAKPLIAGTTGGSDSQAKDQYFLETSVRLGDTGPRIRLHSETMMPASVGYFR